jgi:hypothetical protein
MSALAGRGMEDGMGSPPDGGSGMGRVPHGAGATSSEGGLR